MMAGDDRERLEELAVRATAGDDGAWRCLFDDLSPALYGFLADLTRDRHVAEDLLQQLWVRALSRLHKRRSPVRAWFFTVARNLAIDSLRASSLRATYQRVQARKDQEQRDGMRSSELNDRGPSVINPAVREAVLALPDEQREVVLLRFYAGLSFKELASVIESPMGTVATRLRRALAKLREQLADDGAWAMSTNDRRMHEHRS